MRASASESEYTRLIGIANRYLHSRMPRLHRSDYDDAVQSALCLLIEGKAPTNMDFGQTARWVCVVSRNALRTELRRGNRHISMRAESLSAQNRHIDGIAVDLAAAFMTADIGAKLDLNGVDDRLTAEMFLASLSSDERTVVQLFYEGSPIDSIASTTGLTPSACYKRIERAVKKLRQSVKSGRRGRHHIHERHDSHAPS